MVFSKVGPNQSIEWGQIRVSKSDNIIVRRTTALICGPRLAIPLGFQAGSISKPMGLGTEGENTTRGASSALSPFAQELHRQNLLGLPLCPAIQVSQVISF